MTYEQQKYAPETIQTPQSSSQEGFKPDLKTKIMSGAKDLKDKAIIAGKNFKSALGSATEKANEPKEYVDPYKQKQNVEYRQPTEPVGENADRQTDMKNTVNSTDDLVKTGEQIGSEANKALQNVEIPRSKLVSYGDIINSDEFKGQRVPYLANAIGSNLANLLTGKDYQSYLKQQNQVMSDTYAQNKAARDTAATQANIQDIEAGNKAEMGKQVQMSDAITEQALKRYGLLEDQETKKQILNEIVTQATGKGMDKWNTLSASEKLAAMALMQAYNGDYSVASMVIEKYGDKIFNTLDKLLGVNNGAGGGTEPTGNEPPTTTATVDAYGNEIKAGDKTKYATLYIPGNEEPTLVPLYPATTTNGDAEQQKVADYILNLPKLSNEEKLALAQSYDAQIPWAAKIPGQSVEKKVQGKINKDNKFAQKIEDMAKGKTSEEMYDALIGMASDGSVLTDPEVVKQYEEALAEYGQKTVEDKIKSILSQDAETNEKIKAVETLANTDKYRNLVSQNPALQKLVDNTKEDLVSRATWIDPYNKKASGRLYNALKETTGGNKFTIKDDGTIEIQTGKDKSKILNPYSVKGITKAGTTPDVFLAALNSNVTMDKVREQMGNMPDEDLVPIFKNSPVYKMLEGIVNTTDTGLINNQYWDELVGAYDQWNSY